MDLDQLVRQLEVDRGPYMFLLGAGASVSSGVLSAGLCIQDWKRQLFVAKNRDAAATPLAIQNWCNKESGYPKEGSDAEYSFYAEKCYPAATGRRQYFAKLCAGKKPGLGYQLLALLAKDALIQAVWTTNFDGLVGKPAQREVEVVEVGLDTAPRAKERLVEGKLLCVALHGDYRFDHLKNIKAELRSQDETLRKALLHRLRDFPLIVVGYSGRDDSVMSALQEGYSEPWNGQLFWCGYEEDPNQKVASLLRNVNRRGIEVFYIRGGEFDSLMTELTRFIVSDRLKSRALELIQAGAIPAAAADLDKVRASLKQFALDYADIRAKMKPGNERTMKMEGLISARLRSLRLEPWALLPDLTKQDAEPGKKLAATVLLQQKADPRYLDFLSECMSEQPLVGYHAAVALRYAANALGKEHKRKVGAAISRAKDKLGSRKRTTDRYRVLTAAEGILDAKSSTARRAVT